MTEKEIALELAGKLVVPNLDRFEELEKFDADLWSEIDFFCRKYNVRRTLLRAEVFSILFSRK